MTGEPAGNGETPGMSLPVRASETFSTELLAALGRRDAAAVRALALEAGASRNVAAVSALCEFLVPTQRKWSPPAADRESWTDARSTSIWALGEIGSPDCLPTLVKLLACTRDSVVRSAASSAIDSFGPAATKPLSEFVGAVSEWELEGMSAVLRSLGSVRIPSDRDRTRVAAALTRVASGELPFAPGRWSRLALPSGIATGLLVTALLGAVVLTSSGVEIEFVITALAICLFCGCTVGGYVFLAANVLLSLTRGCRERDKLQDISADTLIRLAETRAIPGLTPLAFAKPDSFASWQARRALTKLLPDVTEADAGRFPAQVTDDLNAALGRNYPYETIAAILKALRHIGNSSSLRQVKKLTRRATTREMFELASSVLNDLEAREPHTRASRVLLRGASEPVGKAEELLRPSNNEQKLRPEQLLRPTKHE